VPLLFGVVPLYREIREGVPVGPDVETVQENLVALGYPEIGTPDGKFGPATTRALKKWQKAVGLAQSGALSPGDVLVLPGQVRVDTLNARLGGPAEGDLVEVTGVERLVTVEVKEANRQYAVVGAKVEVELPDRRTVPGTVRAVVGPTSKDKDSKVVVTVGLDVPAAAPDTGLVRVVLSGARHDGVLVVPVQALVALAEGGYAVEVVTGGERRLVAVELGMFAAGQVEVSGPGLAEGAEVVTTS
jgi:peptidoglycan hydrolase-like protein with peptidoglycan-binding domain